MLAVTSSTGHDLTISCKGCSGEIEFVPQLGPHEPQLGPHEPQLGPHEPQLGPHEPQLLFQVVPAKIVVQILNETKDELEDVMSEHGWHTGLSGQTDEDVDDTTRRLSLSFGQDTVHAISKGKTLTPKHVGFRMNINQVTQSRTLVNFFHNAGHAISYSQVQRVDTTLTKRTLAKLIQNGNFPILVHLLEGKFIQFAADNIDIIEKTLDGKGTFHAPRWLHSKGQS